MPIERGKAVAVVLHDVAPQTWPLYAPFVAALDALGPIPLTLLVVPDYHHRGALTAHPRFRAVIEARIGQGDEVALHGYFHCDDAPLRPNPIDLIRRRLYTHEGEFAALNTHEARDRLERGHALFTQLGWPVNGFVAPAWLLNRTARAALAGLPFLYTSTPTDLIRLPEWRPLAAPSLVWSARSAWRRRISRFWNERRLRQSADQDLIRLGLHPVDMHHGEARAFWLRAIRELLPSRQALTKIEWLRRMP